MIKLHEKSHIHRHLKAESFMINSSGQLRMIKFGFDKKYNEEGNHIELERYNSLLVNEDDSKIEELTPWQRQGLS